MTVAAAARDRAPAAAVRVENLGFRYGNRAALAGVSFEVAAGEIFGVLGPNGGGKTTLFRVLSTLLQPMEGSASLFGSDVDREAASVRERIGVVFQSPSIDPKLTVDENLRYHGRLYALGARELSTRIGAALERLGISDRARDRVESLSGGLRRRVELAKALLTRPQLLLLDEPSTGLDPGARIDLWRYLRDLRERERTTILLTTHLMDEAEQCDRLAILDNGHLISIGTPGGLRSRIGGDIITINTNDPDGLAQRIGREIGERPARVGDVLRLERPDGHVYVRRLVEAFPDAITGISVSKPTLEDVFVHETGHRFWGDA